MNAEAVAYLRHKSKLINQFSERVVFFLPNTMSDDVCFAESPSDLGFSV